MIDIGRVFTIECAVDQAQLNRYVQMKEITLQPSFYPVSAKNGVLNTEAVFITIGAFRSAPSD